MQIKGIYALVEKDFQSVNQAILSSLHSDVPLVQEVGQHIVGSGGKRIRPLLVLLTARACGYQDTQHIQLATIIEFIHTATLLHDDVVDGSQLRRGQPTANALWNNETSVLVGDFLYSRAFQMMVEMQDMQIMGILSNATNIIAEGEVMQLASRNDPNTSEQQYLQIIRHKTAKLFESAVQCAAVLAKQAKGVQQDLCAFGMHVGTAFQLIDDVLDYSASTLDMGKNIGDDLAEGKPTLPLIYAMANSPGKLSSLIEDSIRKGGLEHIEAIKDAIESCGALQYARSIAEQEIQLAQHALSQLKVSPHKQALSDLANFSVSRCF